MAGDFPPGHDQDPYTGHELETGRENAVDFVGDEKYNQDRGVEVSFQWTDTDVNTVCQCQNERGSMLIVSSAM